MTWQALQDGLKAWVATSSGINADDIFWDDEPEGFHQFPLGILRLKQHNSDGGSDEVRYESNGPDEDASVVAMGLRTVTLTVRVRTRDSVADARPYAYLDRARACLELPSAQDAFRALGAGLISSTANVNLTRVYQGRRQLEEAFDIRFNVVSDTAALGIEETIGTIEHVKVRGTVTADTGEEIAVPDYTISKPA